MGLTWTDQGGMWNEKKSRGSIGPGHIGLSKPCKDFSLFSE